jgi:hypothetical protein
LVSFPLEAVHFGDGTGRTRAKFLQKFFGLFAQLFQVWLLSQTACGSWIGTRDGHDDLLFVTARCPRVGLKEDSPIEL